MTSIIAYILLGSVVFLEGDAPPLSVGPVKPLTGQVSTNFRQVDLNGDGQMDLLFPDGAAIQDKGVFPQSAFYPFPPNMTGQIDHWGDLVYCWSATSLQISQWKDGGWVSRHRQALPCAYAKEAENDARLPQYPGRKPNIFDRYLVDLDQDATPELILVDDNGIALYMKDAEAYVKRAYFEVLPERSPVIFSDVVLWPPAARELLLPARKSSCRLWVETRQIAVMTREAVATSERDPLHPIRYHRYEYPFSDSTSLSAVKESQSPPLPLHVQPCNLNDDGNMDYAGGHWKLNETALVPSLIYESWASLDGGKHFAVRAMHAFQRSKPHCNFMDIDSDGDMDWIMEGDDLLENGFREMLGALSARRYLGHELRIYRQEKGEFSKVPDVKQRFRIHLEAPPLLESPMLKCYRAGECLNITGDTNGDGHHDIIVRQRKDELALYIYANGGFPKKPTMTLPISPDEHFAVYDVNRDGLSDLIYFQRGAAEKEEQPTQTVYFAGVNAL